MKESFPETSDLEIPDTRRDLSVQYKTSHVSAFFSYKFFPQQGESDIAAVAQQAVLAGEANGWTLVEVDQGSAWCGRAAHPDGEDVVHSLTVKVRDSVGLPFVRVKLAESRPSVCDVPLSQSPS